MSHIPPEILLLHDLKTTNPSRVQRIDMLLMLELY